MRRVMGFRIIPPCPSWNMSIFIHHIHTVYVTSSLVTCQLANQLSSYHSACVQVTFTEWPQSAGGDAGNSDMSERSCEILP